MKKKSKIFVAGDNTLIGKSIVNRLKKTGFNNIIELKQSIDLQSNIKINKIFKKYKPEYVFIASGKSGGIIENIKFPANLMIDNLLSQTYIIKSSFENHVKKLVFIGSSCVYPKSIKTSSKEKDLLSGSLEKTNQSYSIAKISGIELCRAYRLQHKANFFSVIPTNIYGPGDDFDKEDMHVIPSLIKKIYYAKQKKLKKIKLLGTGKPLREFIYVDDFSSACIELIKSNKKFDLVNIGSDQTVTIHELANLVKNIVNYEGKIIFSSKKFDGSKEKKLNLNKINSIGWKPKTSLNIGLKNTYIDFLKNI